MLAMDLNRRLRTTLHEQVRSSRGLHLSKDTEMTLHLIIGDKRYSSWSLRPALALYMTGAPFTEQVIRLNQPNTRQLILEHSPTGKVPILKPNTALSSIRWRSSSISLNSFPMPVFGLLTPLPGHRRVQRVRRCTAVSRGCALPCLWICAATKPWK